MNKLVWNLGWIATKNKSWKVNQWKKLDLVNIYFDILFYRCLYTTSSELLIKVLINNSQILRPLLIIQLRFLASLKLVILSAELV